MGRQDGEADTHKDETSLEWHTCCLWWWCRRRKKMTCSVTAIMRSYEMQFRDCIVTSVRVWEGNKINCGYWILKSTRQSEVSHYQVRTMPWPVLLRVVQPFVCILSAWSILCNVGAWLLYLCRSRTVRLLLAYQLIRNLRHVADRHVERLGTGTVTRQ